MLSLTPDEFARLGHLWDPGTVVRKDGLFEVPLPCPLLKEDRCTIYGDRPLVCVFYPLEFGEADGEPVMAMQSKCPESRRIAEGVCMAAYDIKKRRRELGSLQNLPRST